MWTIAKLVLKECCSCNKVFCVKRVFSFLIPKPCILSTAILLECPISETLVPMLLLPVMMVTLRQHTKLETLWVLLITFTASSSLNCSSLQFCSTLPTSTHTVNSDNLTLAVELCTAYCSPVNVILVKWILQVDKNK